MQQPSLMWFRQDLRLADNAALRAAAESGPLVCLYVLDDETPGEWGWGGASRWWLHKSLESLASGLAHHGVRLVLRRGAADKTVAGVMAEVKARAVYFTRDHAPWSAGLERRIKAHAEAQGAACHRYGGFLLHEPETVRTGQGEAYKVFTPFARACFALGDARPPRPQPARLEPWTGKLAGERLEDWELLPHRPDWSRGFAVWSPGEAGA
ncbi:MAG: deoxyribodipyrimidine photo-lyase, partial [Parvibaculaceae bacterium]